MTGMLSDLAFAAVGAWYGLAAPGLTRWEVVACGVGAGLWLANANHSVSTSALMPGGRVPVMEPVPAQGEEVL